jgi:hypothetical protein
MIHTDIVYTVEDVLKYYNKTWDTETDISTFPGILPSLTELDLVIKADIWGLSYQIAEDTIRYIDRLKSKVYIVCVNENKITDFLLFSPKGQPREYLPYLKELDPKLKWTKEQRNEIKNKPWKFMACVLQLNKSDNPPDTQDYYKKIFTQIQSKLRNGMYVFSIRDALLVRKDGTDPWIDITGEPVKLGFIPKKFLPVFNSTGGKEYYDIPIPTYEDLQFLRGIPEDFGFIDKSIENFHKTWKEKLPIAVFRGGASGCGYDERNNQRIRLTKLGEKLMKSKNPELMNLLDVGITNVAKKKYHFYKDTGLGYIQENNISIANRLNKQQQSNYKYIIEVEGNVAAHRIASDMLLGSVPLIVDTEYTLWFQHLLKEYVHYIPVKSDLSDLVEKIKWCHEHDEICEKIAKNAQQFALDILQKDVIMNVIINSINLSI